MVILFKTSIRMEPVEMKYAEGSEKEKRKDLVNIYIQEVRTFHKLSEKSEDQELFKVNTNDEENVKFYLDRSLRC